MKNNNENNDDDAVDVIGTFQVYDVQVYGRYVLHKGVIDGSTNDDNDEADVQIKVGMPVNCIVKYERRNYITPNHSTTHILNAALRQVLGDKVDQRGGLCNVDKLRFEFSYKQALTTTELQQVEQICRQVAADQLIVSSQYLPLDDAMKIDGVRAVFGEVYPDPVRVVTIGSDTSIQFCGGTHISNTAEAIDFVIIEETAVAKGVRRISAVTRDASILSIEAGTTMKQKVIAMEQLDPTTVPDLEKMLVVFVKN